MDTITVAIKDAQTEFRREELATGMVAREIGRLASMRDVQMCLSKEEFARDMVPKFYMFAPWTFSIVNKVIPFLI